MGRPDRQRRPPSANFIVFGMSATAVGNDVHFVVNHCYADGSWWGAFNSTPAPTEGVNSVEAIAVAGE